MVKGMDTDKGPFALEVMKLTFYYKSLCAVNGISFNLKSGKILGLLGPNGAGKTTTMKMLTTLLPPTAGTSKILGFDLVKDPATIRKYIGYVPQLLSADGDLTGYENLLLSAKLYAMMGETREKEIWEMLDFMGLRAFAHDLVNRYSGGMIRRLEIAQALIHKPKILFLDEPTTGLDPVARRAVWERIQEWRDTYGTTIFLNTHDMEEAEYLCDIVAFMFLGHIVKMNPPGSLKAELGEGATLGDVFAHYTGTSIKAGGDYEHARMVRRTISHRK